MSLLRKAVSVQVDSKPQLDANRRVGKACRGTMFATAVCTGGVYRTTDADGGYQHASKRKVLTWSSSRLGEAQCWTSMLCNSEPTDMEMTHNEVWLVT